MGHTINKVLFKITAISFAVTLSPNVQAEFRSMMPEQAMNSTEIGSTMMATSLSYAINVACPEILTSVKTTLATIGYSISDNEQGRYNLYDSVTSSEVSYLENKLRNDFIRNTTEGYTQSCIDQSSVILGAQESAANHGDIPKYYSNSVIQSSGPNQIRMKWQLGTGCAPLIMDEASVIINIVDEINSSETPSKCEFAIVLPNVPNDATDITNDKIPEFSNTLNGLLSKVNQTVDPVILTSYTIPQVTMEKIEQARLVHTHSNYAKSATSLTQNAQAIANPYTVSQDSESTIELREHLAAQSAYQNALTFMSSFNQVDNNLLNSVVVTELAAKLGELQTAAYTASTKYAEYITALGAYTSTQTAYDNAVLANQEAIAAEPELTQATESAFEAHQNSIIVTNNKKQLYDDALAEVTTAQGVYSTAFNTARTSQYLSGETEDSVTTDSLAELINTIDADLVVLNTIKTTTETRVATAGLSINGISIGDSTNARTTAQNEFNAAINNSETTSVSDAATYTGATFDTIDILIENARLSKEQAAIYKTETENLYQNHIMLTDIANGLLAISGGDASSIVNDFDVAYNIASNYLTDNNVTKEELLNDYIATIDDNDNTTTPIIIAELQSAANNNNTPSENLTAITNTYNTLASLKAVLDIEAIEAQISNNYHSNIDAEFNVIDSPEKVFNHYNQLSENSIITHNKAIALKEKIIIHDAIVAEDIYNSTNIERDNIQVAHDKLSILDQKNNEAIEPYNTYSAALSNEGTRQTIYNNAKTLSDTASLAITTTGNTVNSLATTLNTDLISKNSAQITYNGAISEVKTKYNSWASTANTDSLALKNNAEAIQQALNNLVGGTDSIE